jgi:hypothetical protein
LAALADGSSDQIVQLGRLRFSIAHEIAHYLLGHRIPSELTTEASRHYTKQQEREADVFATEFLMPEEMVRPFCERAIDLATAQNIVESFRSSIVAAAVRYVELSPMPCAVAYSEVGVVEWAKRSRSFSARIPERLELSASTAAFDFHTPGILDPVERVVPASAWIGAASTSATEFLVEYAVLVPEPGWGGVLSLLGSLPHA